jgi:hypothetical protein
MGKILGWVLLVIMLVIGQGAGAQDDLNSYCYEIRDAADELNCALARAMIDQDLPEIERLVAEAIARFPDLVGVPEAPTEFEAVPTNVELLSPSDVPTAFTPIADAIEANAWWLDYPSPPDVPFALRHVANVITGTLAARRAGANDPDRLLEIARGAADYLIWTQEQTARGVYPFPDLSSYDGRLADLSQNFMAAVEIEGIGDQVMLNGWVFDDLGAGGLYFDTGLIGVALLELYEATGETRYLESALMAAEWALEQPAVPNWNYNSFLVFFLARAYDVIGDVRYLDGATRFAQFGIYPGQLQEGQYAGRWVDPHNARLVYHYLIIRGLGELVAVMPHDDPDLPQAAAVLSLALRVRNAEIIEQGAAHPLTVLEVLARLALRLPEGRIADEGQQEALSLLGRYTTAAFRRGEASDQAANAWGLYLEVVAREE